MAESRAAGQLHGSKEIFLLLLLDQIVEDHDGDVDLGELCGWIGEEAERIGEEAVRQS